jgi:hypothetical protein
VNVYAASQILRGVLPLYPVRVQRVLIPVYVMLDRPFLLRLFVVEVPVFQVRLKSVQVLIVLAFCAACAVVVGTIRGHVLAAGREHVLGQIRVFVHALDEGVVGPPTPALGVGIFLLRREFINSPDVMLECHGPALHDAALGYPARMGIIGDVNLAGPMLVLDGRSRRDLVVGADFRIDVRGSGNRVAEDYEPVGLASQYDHVGSLALAQAPVSSGHSACVVCSPVLVWSSLAYRFRDTALGPKLSIGRLGHISSSSATSSRG